MDHTDIERKPNTHRHMIHRKRFEVAGHLRILYEETQYYISARQWYRDNVANGDDVEFLGYIAALAMEKGSGDFEGVGHIRAVPFAEHGAASVARVAAWVSMGFVVVLPVVRIEYQEPETFRNGRTISIDQIADVRAAIVELMGVGVTMPTVEDIIVHLSSKLTT